MKLFDVLPDKFFQLLTGSNKQLYAEAVLLIYEQSRQERFGIRYDVLRDLLQELIETHKELGMDFVEEEDEELAQAGSPSASDTQQLTLDEMARAQANALIRRLTALKWIDVEVRDQFQQYVVLPHYSSRILALFQELCESRTVEYQRFAFVTYQLLTGEEAKERPSFAVREAERMSEQLQQELVTLYNNMKHHMEQVVLQTSIKDVLDHHFDVYKSQIIDVSYHRLKTSDHVSRYRFQILQTVQTWLLDRDWMQEAAQDAVRNELYADVEEAKQGMREALYKIEAIYNGLDEIFYHIDLRHNQYLRSSYDRARYLSQHHQGIDQQIAEILERFSQLRTKLPEEEDPWQDRFNLQHAQTLEEASLLPPKRRRPPHQPQKHIVVPISDELKEELRSQNIERMRKAITRKKVDTYVLDKLGDREGMELAELSPSNVEELLMMTYIYLYGQDGGSPFGIQRQPERSIIQVGGYRFDNHNIVRATHRNRR